MYFLPKFLSKIIKKDGFILISPENQKFIIGTPKKDKPLEVKMSKKVSELKCIMHSERWIPEYIISKDNRWAGLSAPQTSQLKWSCRKATPVSGHPEYRIP